MSESAEELPPATGDGTPEVPDTARTITPVSFDKDFSFKTGDDDFNLYDFRPQPVSVNEVDPKGLSAPAFVDSLISEEDLEDESSANPETTVPVEKDSTQPKESKSGSPTSSNKTSAGKTEPPAPKE